jgi:hypothetical protein
MSAIRILVAIYLSLLSIPSHADTFTDSRNVCLKNCLGQCCSERCDYVGCIARESSFMWGGVELSDPASGAEVACQPFVQIIKRCGETFARLHPPPPQPQPNFVGSWKSPAKITIVLNQDGTGAWVDARGGPKGSMQENGTFKGKWSASGDKVTLDMTNPTYGNRSGAVTFTLSDGRLHDQWGDVYSK